jgi:uncharacterized membrane protein YsdA (DUF1294 family)
MTPAQVLTLLTTAGLGYALLAAAYIIGAWYLSRRWGVRVLLPVWLVASLLAAVAGVYRLHTRSSAAGNVPTRITDLRLLLAALIFSLLGFGLASLSVRKRLRRASDAGLTLMTVLAGVGAFFGGLGLGFVPVLVLDVRRLWAP